MTTLPKAPARTTLATICLSVFALFTAQAGDSTSRVSPIRLSPPGKVIKAEVGTDKTIHVLLDAVDGPQYRKSQDNGVTFSEPLAIVDSASQKPGLKFSAWDLVVGKGGRVHVALGNNAWKLKLPQEEWGLYYATLTTGATSFSPLRNINRKPSEGFSLAANERGDVTACFLSGKLFTMRSRDNGESFGATAELEPAWNPCDCCTTASAYGPDGRLALLYREETGNDRDMFVVLWDQSGKGKPTRRAVSTTPWKLAACPMTYFSINRTETGYVVAWPTKGNIYFARLDKDGAVLPPGEIKTSGTCGMRTGLVAVSARDDATLVAWRTKEKDALRWQLYNAKGEAEGKPGSEAGSGSGAAAVALADGKFLVFP